MRSKMACMNTECKYNKKKFCKARHLDLDICEKLRNEPESEFLKALKAIKVTKIVYTSAYVEELKKEFEVEKHEIELQTLQELFLDINKKEPITDENGKFIGVKELTLNDVKKIILDKIKELETGE